MNKGRKCICTECRKETVYELNRVPYSKCIKDKEYVFNITIALCGVCGNEVFIPGLIDLNAREVDEQYREKKEIISVTDIQKLMEIYNIGKAPLSLALGYFKNVAEMYDISTAEGIGKYILDKLAESN